MKGRSVTATDARTAEDEEGTIGSSELGAQICPQTNQSACPDALMEAQIFVELCDPAVSESRNRSEATGYREIFAGTKRISESCKGERM
ncbi:unnamed protein product [Calypogeia fissa]